MGNEIQQIVSNLLSILLVVPGLILTVAGLMYWLGGLKWLGFPAVFTAAMAGFIPAWIYFRDNLYVMVLAPVVCAAFGLFLKRTTVATLGMILAALATVAIFEGPKLADAQYWKDRPMMTENANTENKIPVYMNYLQEWTEYLISKVQTIIQQIPDHVKILSGLVFVSGMILVIFRPRPVAAVTCSVLGTVSVGLGIAMLVTFKGFQPFADFAFRPGLYLLIAAVMIPLGTGIQLALCPKKKKDHVEELTEQLKQGKKS